MLQEALEVSDDLQSGSVERKVSQENGQLRIRLRKASFFQRGKVLLRLTSLGLSYREPILFISIKNPPR